MTERERLIELCDTNNGWVDEVPAEDFADYLLANGVIVPPCKVGDVVYGISRQQIIPITIDAIQYISNEVNIFGSNEEYFGYSTVHLDINNQIGTEWYCTKEEAEAALEGGGKE